MTEEEAIALSPTADRPATATSAAAMVSNLMVVLCGERETQPAVNTAAFYR